MKPIKILVILCIMLDFGLECIKAQIPQKSSYQTSHGIKSLTVGNLGPAYNRLNTSSLSRPPGWVPAWADITGEAVFTFNATVRNYYNLINSQGQLNRAIVKFQVDLTAKEDYGITSTFNIKLESLNGIPFIDPAIAYYCPFKRTDEQTLCGCRLYRVAAFVIPRMLQVKYPGAHETIIYPQAYLQPRYPLTDTSK
jgi:hypothetical protein